MTPLVAFGVNKFAQNDVRADDSIKLRLQGPKGLGLGLSAALKNSSGRSQPFDLVQVTPQCTVVVWAVKYKGPEAAGNGMISEHIAYGVGGHVPIGPRRVYAHYIVATMDPL